MVLVRSFHRGRCTSEHLCRSLSVSVADISMRTHREYFFTLLFLSLFALKQPAAGGDSSLRRFPFQCELQHVQHGNFTISRLGAIENIITPRALRS